MKENKDFEWKIRCPDCKKEKWRMNHHIIPKRLMNYLVDIGNFKRKDMINLRRELTVRICRDCESKFHTGEFYNEYKTLRKLNRSTDLKEGKK